MEMETLSENFSLTLLRKYIYECFLSYGHNMLPRIIQNSLPLILIHFQSRKRLYNHKCPSVSPLVCQSQNPPSISESIIQPYHHHPSSSFIISHLHHPSKSFILQLLCFSACLVTRQFDHKSGPSDHFP